jgi:hypothetical protein
MMAIRVSPSNVKDALMSVVDELSVDRMVEVLEFALFMKARQAQQRSGCEPVQRLEDLWGDFWPEDESVDDFISAVRRWRREDVTLHKDLR